MNKLKISTITLALFFLFSCNEKVNPEKIEATISGDILEKNDEKLTSVKTYSELAYTETKEVKIKANDGLALMKQNCYACHSVTTKSHDDIIAPPMIAIKKRYLKEYNSKEDFVKAFVNYASDPKAKNSLMLGAVDKFKVMPKQSFAKDDLTKIAVYVYDNEIEVPEWFEDHFQQKHNSGKGMGKGMGKGRNN